jgi:hypothetical protein
MADLRSRADGGLAPSLQSPMGTPPDRADAREPTITPNVSFIVLTSNLDWDEHWADSVRWNRAQALRLRASAASAEGTPASPLAV